MDSVFFILCLIFWEEKSDKTIRSFSSFTGGTTLKGGCLSTGRRPCWLSDVYCALHGGCASEWQPVVCRRITDAGAQPRSFDRIRMRSSSSYFRVERLQLFFMRQPSGIRQCCTYVIFFQRWTLFYKKGQSRDGNKLHRAFSLDDVFFDMWLSV
jgi:hypothetical protein